MSGAPHDLFATCPRGLESVLAAELQGLGAGEVAPAPAGVSFRGSLETAYRACLWSRTASRVLLALAQVPAGDASALYESVGALRWEEHLAPEGTLAVDFTGTSAAIGHTVFGAQRVKDAIVDRLRRRAGRRPAVDLARPDLRVNVHLFRGQARVAVDLSGESLHRRGYREEGVAAPLKENLAAGILLRAGWPALAAAGAPFLDPLCGSGTLPIEAALIAGDVAPGLLRERFGFTRWRRHDAGLWERLRAEALERRERGGKALPPIMGSDGDVEAARAGRTNLRRAGLAGRVVIERRLLADVRPPRGAAPPRPPRREPALRRAARERGRAAPALRGAGRGAAGALPGMEGRGPHRESGPRPADRDPRLPQPRALQRRPALPPLPTRRPPGALPAPLPRLSIPGAKELDLPRGLTYHFSQRNVGGLGG